MALIDCSECGKEISDKAMFCPHCGMRMRGGFFGYEYRTTTKLFGLPLVHIVMGIPFDPLTGRIRVARGIIAIGSIAMGVVAAGGVAFGGIAIGGLAIALGAALGGCAIGLLAIGGMAIGLVAIGGAALGYYALGGGAWGAHALGANTQDPKAVEFFKRYLGPWVERMRPPGNG